MKGVTDQYAILYRTATRNKAKFNAQYAVKLEQVVAWSGDPKAQAQSGGVAPNMGYSWGADILCGYKPPSKAARLTDDDGKSLRPGAEKASQLMQLMLLMYTDNGRTGEHRVKVYDPYGGTLTMGLACLILGRVYIGCELDAEVFGYAKQRLIKYIAARLRTGAYTRGPVDRHAG